MKGIIHPGSNGATIYAGTISGRSMPEERFKKIN
jgi:hypothetical protein